MNFLKDKTNYYSHLALNAKYRMFAFLAVYLLIYLFFYSFTVSECMNENTDSTPIIAESKPVRSYPTGYPRNPKSIFQREVEYFCGFAETIEEKSVLLKQQQMYIYDLEQDLASSEKNNIELQQQISETKADVKRITSKYIDQEYDRRRLRDYNQKLYGENYNLRQQITKLEQQLNEIKYNY